MHSKKLETYENELKKFVINNQKEIYQIDLYKIPFNNIKNHPLFPVYCEFSLDPRLGRKKIENLKFYRKFSKDWSGLIDLINRKLLSFNKLLYQYKAEVRALEFKEGKILFKLKKDQAEIKVLNPYIQAAFILFNFPYWSIFWSQYLKWLHVAFCFLPESFLSSIGFKNPNIWNEILKLDEKNIIEFVNHIEDTTDPIKRKLWEYLINNQWQQIEIIEKLAAKLPQNFLKTAVNYPIIPKWSHNGQRWRKFWYLLLLSSPYEKELFSTEKPFLLKEISIFSIIDSDLIHNLTNFIANLAGKNGGKIEIYYFPNLDDESFFNTIRKKKNRRNTKLYFIGKNYTIPCITFPKFFFSMLNILAQLVLSTSPTRKVAFFTSAPYMNKKSLEIKFEKRILPKSVNKLELKIHKIPRGLGPIGLSITLSIKSNTLIIEVFDTIYSNRKKKKQKEKRIL